MTAGWCSRTTRAAVFAAVCVLLATLGHVLMSGTSVPWWALAPATVVTAGAAWCLAGRERGLVLVPSVAVVAQTALHAWFSYAQERSLPPAAPRPSASVGGMADGTPSMDHMASMAHMGHAAHSMTHGASTTGATGVTDFTAGMGHAMGGMSSSGMLAAHLLAALLSGLWLAHGERAAFRVLRAVAGRLAAPLRLSLALPALPHRPRLLTRRGRSARRPRWLFLVYAITSRGPPTGTAVV
ncbi:hypothetical protein SAM40697_0477 [Streptomyces ambofaciens]|uniref:Integral-membrane protein n=1 Tax=Streptomyces ambofaciens TaxID=1889 RepID=A0ABM6AT54_STRAM|nr:hypothetical protein [Streptomyces ambofaciens]ANB04439.1 hypothetical protein SAM40697_0477 [Streptomyces ambofaciens]